ncbi:MAG: hypothetical protein P8Y02_14720 [Deinococcales bacterium]
MAGNTRGTRTRNATVEHAVVLGASMAGLAAAAALATRARRVTVVERDPLPAAGDGPDDAPRRGVPQGTHVHFLLPGGVAALDALLPGITEDLRAAGARLLDGRGDHRMLAGGDRVLLDGLDPAWILVAATRPLIERVVRDRVVALDNVTLRDATRVLGLEAANGGRDIRGVRVARERGADEEVLEADLVLDAMGRASHTPRWLEDLGYGSPPVQRLDVDARVQGERWMVSLMGLAGDQAPADLDGFRAYARSLWARDIYDLVCAAEPLGDAVTGGFPANVRHRYDLMRRFPDGLVVLGDALCATNPHFARGMNVAAREAVELRQVVGRVGRHRVGPRFFRSTRALTNASWTFVTNNDLLQPDIQAPRTFGWRLVTGYSKRVTRASHRDPVVARAFMDVFGVRSPPTRLLRPDIVLRTLLALRRERPTTDLGDVVQRERA